MGGWINGAANSGFDTTFLVLELLGAILLLCIVVFIKKLLPYYLVVTIIANLLLIFLPAIYWYIVYPTTDGIEGAGRLLFILAFCGIDFLLILFLLFRLILLKRATPK